MRLARDALEVHREVINGLNVYPVPDGDTGTNMLLTLESVCRELDDLDQPELRDAPDVSDRSDGSDDGRFEAVCRAIAHGSLMGARGNSGVILSQLLRGLVGRLASDPGSGGATVADALRAASDAARAAVLKPVEGTILTVAEEAARGAGEAAGRGCDLVAVLEAARAAARRGLERTPELLPTLARAGVVDAGGYGLVLLLDALGEAVGGCPVAKDPAQVLPAGFRVQRASAPPAGTLSSQGQESIGVADHKAGGPGGITNCDQRAALRGEREASAAGLATSAGERAAGEPAAGEPAAGEPAAGEPAAGEPRPGHAGEPRYEVMFLLEAPDESIPALKDAWAALGESIVVVGGDGLWNCHVHTDDVGAAIEAGIDVGRPRDIRVTDLLEQVEQLEEERWVREGQGEPVGAEASPPPRTAVVAVANGEGIARIFRSLGVRHLVAGGQSMNPSTEELLKVVEESPSFEVVILPNNENVQPVALQVAEVASKPVRVVPTSGIVEGFAALLEYDPEASAEENAASMANSARRVASGDVTQAVRDAVGPDGPIAAGSWIGVTRQGIEVVAASLEDAVVGLVDALVAPGHELVTLIEGEGASEASTRRIRSQIEERHPGLSVEVLSGGQPLYPYLVGVE
jgi:dihydroxyacetone kinase-like predicted kinase